jgi:lysyl-tRNA synthetase, class II
MATLQELRNERLRKLEELRKLGVNPYPAKAHRTHAADEIVEKFAELEGKEVSLTGRIVSTRKFGKIAFFVLKDASGHIQLFLKHDVVQPLDGPTSQVGFDQINLLDPGDFIEVTGPAIKTQTGEISVEVRKLRLLTKSLRPMPTEQEGFTDKEQRLRRRYVDTNVNKGVHQRYLRRSAFWQATRDFLRDRGFVEINIPVLEGVPGGADARPFVTYMDALDQDFYLRISHELPLKRLLAGGYEKVFDIGPRFRNENYTDEHLPEHVAMEWYWAYADWEQGMTFTEELVRRVADKTWGKRQFKLLNGQEVDLGPDGQAWPRISFVGVIREHYGLDVFDCTLGQIQEQLKKHGIELEKSDNRARGLDKLWKKVRVTLAGPAFLVDIPTFLQPLAKVQADDSRLTEQFNLILGGTEASKAYSELNDPLDQLHRFQEQQVMRDAGDDEAQMLDIDFVEMLEYGMPPACGFGFSERLFWMLEGVTAREGVVFPQLRHEVDETTKATYPELFARGEAVHGAVRPQNFSKKIVAVVDKEIEPWRALNAVAHMTAIIGNETKKDRLTSGDYFVGSDGTAIPRNSQYPIIIMRADEKDLHKLFGKVKTKNIPHHVFIKEMQDTSNDQEIVETLKNQSMANTTFYGVAFLAPNDLADELTKGYQLFR